MDDIDDLLESDERQVVHPMLVMNEFAWSMNRPGQMDGTHVKRETGLVLSCLRWVFVRVASVEIGIVFGTIWVQ